MKEQILFALRSEVTAIRVVSQSRVSGDTSENITTSSILFFYRRTSFSGLLMYLASFASDKVWALALWET